MSRQRAFRFALACLAVSLGASPALAYDALRDAVSRLPDAVAQTKSGFLFEFISPSAVASWALRDWPAISDEGAITGITKPDAARERTAIAFRDLDAILVGGDPPNTFMYLAGPGIAPDAVSAAFRKRNFDESNEGGAVVFAHGEDAAIDIRGRDPADPFGGPMGLSQRVAVVPGHVVESRAWAPFRSVLPMLGGPETYLGTRLAHMVAAAAADGGPGMTGYAAHGVSVAATLGSAELPLAPDGTLDFDKPIKTPRQALPPYLFAILIAAEAADGNGVAQIAVYFPSLADAEAGGKSIAARLADFKKPDGVSFGAVGATAAADDPGAIAVISVHVRSGEFAHPAETVRRRWLSAIYRRAFTPLAVFQ